MGPADGIETLVSNQHFDAGITLKLSVDKHFLFHSYTIKDNIYTKNAAFICLKNDEIGVDFVKNGKLEKNFLKNIPTAVSFVDGKFQIGKEALKMRESFNSFVITDLVKIMMTNFTELEINKDWGFNVTKTENDEILLDFDTFRGRRKSTPAFLFACILKWIILSVEECFGGQQPDTVVIVSKELNENLKKQLKISYEKTKLQLNDFQIQYHKLIDIKE